MVTKKLLPAIVLFSFLTAGVAQGIREKTAWQRILRQNPAAADDESIGWRDRLILHVLAAEQADDYYSGRADELSLRLADGQTLARYLESRLSPNPGLLVALPQPCTLFRVEDGADEFGLRSQGDLSAQGGAPDGCNVPSDATALLLRVRAGSAFEGGVKLWAADLPEPATPLLETTDGNAETTAIISLCRDCEGLRMRSQEPAVLEGAVLGYLQPQPPGGGAVTVPFGPRDGFVEGADTTFFGLGAGASNVPFEGLDNAFFGKDAGNANTTGDGNSFFGAAAGLNNTTAGSNSFFGATAGLNNTTGSFNSFFGEDAGFSNTTEDNNTFIGAESDGATSITNATALGYRAKVSQSDSLVLGSIAGLNGAASDVKVGIGTPTPDEALHVHRSDGTAHLLVEETSAAIATRIQFSLVNNGGPFFNLVNSDNGAQWSFAQNALGSFQFTALGTGGPEFLIRQDGTVQMGPGTTVNFDLRPNGDLFIPNGMVMDASHSSLKKDFEPVSGREVLDKVVQLELSTWRYKKGSRGRHLGPMAEDFHRLLGLGEDDRSIAALDGAGVSLAAIQGLYKLLQETRTELASRDAEVDQLRAELAEIRSLLERER